MKIGVITTTCAALSLIYKWTLFNYEYLIKIITFSSQESQYPMSLHIKLDQFLNS